MDEINKTSDNWHKITEWIASSRIRTLLTTLLLLIIGMFASAIVNYISTDPLFAKWFFTGGIGALVVLVIGIMLGKPFFDFKFRYDFISGYEDKLAKNLFYFSKRADSLVKAEDGVMALQLFKVERHTYDDNVLYNFQKIIDKKAERSSISEVRPKKMKVPIDFFEWFYKFDQELLPPSTEKYNKYINQMVFDFISNKQTKEINETKDDAEKKRKQKKMEEAFDAWGVKIKEKTIYKSIHYITLFNVIDNTIIKEQKNLLDISGNSISNRISMHDVYKMSYNKSKMKKKKHRLYYAINLSYDMNEEGKHDFIALLISDSRVIPDVNTAAAIFNYLLKESL